MADFKIISVDSSNVEKYGFFCVKNKKLPGYIAKLLWLKQCFKEGMRLKLIETAEGKHGGFLEYAPGESTWRIVNAPDYLVINCIWVASSKFPEEGMAAALLDNCLEDAGSNGKLGVAVVTSDGSFMARRDIFLKNGFEQVDVAKPHFQLLIKPLKKGPIPNFPKNWDERLSKYNGLNLIYTNQCPYIGKVVEELPAVAEKHEIQLNLVELTNSEEARNTMPSPYGMFNLVYNDKLLADHPISATRFKNILQRDLKLDMKS